MLFVGLDWAVTHHDVAVMAEGGRVVTARRVAEGLAGLTALYELLAAHAGDPAEVVVGTETDRGLVRGERGDHAPLSDEDVERLQPCFRGRARSGV